jgi:acyl-CoA thioesterase FadM
MKETSSNAQTPLVGDPGPYRAEVLVRFAYCDPAEIVFCPHHVEIFKGMVKYWFRDKLGHFFSGDFCAWMGLASCALECRFFCSKRHGRCAFFRDPREVSRHKLDYPQHRPQCAGGKCARDVVVLVLSDARENRRCAIQDDLRKRIEPFCMAQ